MQRMLAIIAFATIGYLPCFQCSHDTALRLFPESRPTILSPLPPDPDPALLGGLQDAERVETWIIRSHPGLQVNSIHADVFGHYEKHKFKDLRQDQQDVVMSIIYQSIDCREIKEETVSMELGNVRGWDQAMQIAEQQMKTNPEWKCTGKWSHRKIEFTRPVASEMEIIAERSSIWKHTRFGNYLISCSQTTVSVETVFVIGAGKKVLWKSRNNRRDEPPDPSATFPLLIINNQKFDEFDDSIYELHANYKAMLLENRRLISSNHEVTRHIDGVNSENQRLRMKGQELTAQVCAARAETERFNISNRRMMQQIETLNGEIAECKANGIVLEQEHRDTMDQMIDQKEHWSSIIKWCCIVGGIAVFLSVLVTICLFQCCASNRKKQSERQRLRDLLSVHVDDRKVDSILDRPRKVGVEIQEGMKQDGNPKEGVQEHAVDARVGRRFNDLMMNSAVVQDVLMDDVMAEMEAEGAGGTVTGAGED